jgi:hypothetical protein
MVRYKFIGGNVTDSFNFASVIKKYKGTTVTQITINRLEKVGRNTYRGLWKGKYFWGAKFIKL